MKRHVLPPTRLYQVIEHKRRDPCSSPFRVREHEGDVGIVGVLRGGGLRRDRRRIGRHHEREADDELAVEDNAGEIGVLEAFGDVDAWPEELLTESVDRRDVLGPHVAVVDRGAAMRWGRGERQGRGQGRGEGVLRICCRGLGRLGGR